MADRLLVDLDASGRASVSAWLDGDLPGPVGEPVTLNWPLTSDELEDLRWYLEDYLRAPFGVYEDRGDRIARRLPSWGRTMFTALFGSGPARDAYVQVRTRAAHPGSTEIVLRSAVPAWLGLPWELLCDPRLPTPLVLDGVGLSRGLPAANLGNAFDVGGRRLRVLMVISRPDGARDVGYRMIARPLLRRLEAVRGRVEVEVLRPPTLEALAERLRTAREAGTPFQIVHFDGHGALTDEGVLVFERPGGGADHVGADRIARVLADARVPVVVLNACQSGAVGKQLEAAVATRLLAGGASAVVAMSYSVYAVAAAEFMTAFYERLFAGDTIGEAVRAGRAQMARRPGRPSPKGELPLEDWAVPVHYLRREVRFPELRSAPASARPEPSLEAALDRLRERGPGERDDPLAPEGEFVGRDTLFHTLEAAARNRRVVVLHGPGGTGKTELAKAFGRWWRDTGGVGRPEWVIWHSFEPGVASFGLDGVVSAIGLRAYGADFARQNTDTRRELVRDLLREHRLLVVWDNFESVASMPDPDGATAPLDEAARGELKDFLAEVAAGGRSVVLVTSRTPEHWLGDLRRVTVGGLSHDEAVEYADHVLQPFPAAAPRRADRAFADLLEWLDGHPLSMRLILPHLDTTDPAALLSGLHGGTALPAPPGGDRTTSLPSSISYSLAHLDPVERRLLAAVCLFQGVADARVLAEFSRHERTPQRFRGVDSRGWDTVLDRAAQVGLLTGLGRGMYRTHPALPAYLAERWRADDPAAYAAQRADAEEAMLFAVTGFAEWLRRELHADGASRAYRTLGLHLRTLGHLLAHSLAGRLWTNAMYLVRPLYLYWQRSGLNEEILAWSDRARLALEGPDGTPPLLGEPGGELWLLVARAQAGRLQIQARFDAAETVYTEILTMLGAHPEPPREQLATAYDELGKLAQVRDRLDEAEQWFGRALALRKGSGDPSGEAEAYRKLGLAAQERKQWEEADRWLRRALAVTEEAGDRRGMADLFSDLGVVAVLRGRGNEAEQWYHRLRAAKEGAAAEHPRRRAHLCHKLGLLAMGGVLWDEAERWYREALAIEEQLGDRSAMAGTCSDLGRVAHAKGRLDEAEQWYLRCLTIEEALGDKRSLSLTYHEMSGLAASRGRTGEALEWAVRSATLFDRFPHPSAGSRPRDLARLTGLLGTAALEQYWARVTGTPLPADVRQWIETHGSEERR
ncbi:CHAT domain-containing protein [Streptomyces sp. KLMMK]|uniref:CHAT domain-containing protein n=1 Tax=Streptomyces sp. KLMMK TaxID=3109353 RepID=UPI003000BC82